MLAFGYMLAIIVAGLGVALSVLCLQGGIRAPKGRARRTSALVLGWVGLSVSGLTALTWLAAVIREFT
jgi:hypothetical protein